MRSKIFLTLGLAIGLLLVSQPAIAGFNSVAQDTVEEQVKPVPEKKDTLKTEDDYQVERKGDDWLETWETIKPRVKEFFSDEQGEELEYDEHKYEHEDKRKKRGKHGFFNGAALGWHWEFIPTDFDALNDYGFNSMDIDVINGKINAIGIDEQLDKTIPMRGFGGWVFLPKNIRIGGYGGRGRLVTNGKVEIDGANVGREVEFKLRTGGFLVEKVFHPFNNSEIYFGTTLGRSTARINITQNTASPGWKDIWDQESISDDFRVKLKSQYFSATPSIGVRYNFWHWLGVGAKVGYYYGKPDRWEINGEKLVDVPDMDFSNVIWGLNLYIGG
ncbi:MAG: hypothetical protein K9N00_03630 [Candidatus Marinimicrobia bacterium]|nr:hypothetical protein [Candidatus Neomarinimicrobiota bacterium]